VCHAIVGELWVDCLSNLLEIILQVGPALEVGINCGSAYMETLGYRSSGTAVFLDGTLELFFVYDRLYLGHS